MTTDSKILDRIRALLELAASANVNEAGNAAAQAQRLMTRHAIDAAALEIAPDAAADEPVEHAALHAHGRQGSRTMPNWIYQLGAGIAEVNGCKVYQSGRVLGIIGRASDAAAARYLLAYVMREINRLAPAESALRGGMGRTWMNNFRMAAAKEVARRLGEAHKAERAAARVEADQGDTLGTGAALARVDVALARLDSRRAAATVYGAKHLNLRKSSGSSAAFNADARAAGKRAGAGINVGVGGAQGLGSGSRAALGQ